MSYSQHGASVQGKDPTHASPKPDPQAAQSGEQLSGQPNGGEIANVNHQTAANATAYTLNVSAGTSGLPYKSGDSLSQYLQTSALDIIKHVSASTNINAASPEWAAAREQVLRSMASRHEPPVPLSQPRGRGRGRPRTTPYLNGDRSSIAAAGMQMAGTPAAIPIRRGRGGRPRGSRGRGRGRGSKRKRDDDTEGAGSDSDDDKSDDSNSIPTTPTVTKSGRSITKPSQFNPAPQSSPTSGTKRKRAYYRREIDQILCVKCSRGHSPPSNQIVLCDGCDSAYHQWCHDPMVDKEVAENIHSSWFCGHCLHAREAEALPLEQRVGGADLSPEERTTYLSTLSSPTLVWLLNHATSLQPDLPIFAPNTRHLIKSNAQSSQKTLAALPTPPTSQPASIAGHPRSAQPSITTPNKAHNRPTAPPPPQPTKNINGSIDAYSRSEDDPYPDYSNEDGDQPATYPRPGRGPIKLRPTTDKEDLPFMMEDNREVFSHLVDDGHGNLVPAGSRKEAWLARAGLAEKPTSSLLPLPPLQQQQQQQQSNVAAPQNGHRQPWEYPVHGAARNGALAYNGVR